MSSEETDVWIARPQEVDDEQMRSLELTLDLGEIDRASRFRFVSDRRAYVVAHGIRRIALGDRLGVEPGSLVFTRQSSGVPLLMWPGGHQVFFSHAHSRKVVAFAVASASAVGVDVECVVQTTPDFDLLAPYMVLPHVSQRDAEVGTHPAGQFFFYWTALEAFWKAAGKGLSPENPRIYCEKNDEGIFEITLQGSVGDRCRWPRATVSRIDAPKGCVISLAHRYMNDEAGQTSNPSLPGTSRSSKKRQFFQQTKRHKNSDFISIVSVCTAGSVRS